MTGAGTGRARLELAVGPDEVAARLVDATGRVVAGAAQDLGRVPAGPGCFDLTAEQLWQATLAAARQVLEGAAVAAADPVEVGLGGAHEALVVWDRETLGAPRPALAHDDVRASVTLAGLRASGAATRLESLVGRAATPRALGVRLRWLAEHDPRVWALVTEGRYAVGGVTAYLLARLTRGTWHVTPLEGAAGSLLLSPGADRWSEEACVLLAVPVGALPELVASPARLATTDPRCFLGRSVPVSALPEDR